jgi:predicted acyl esterase
MIPMRDGVKLFTVIYSPLNATRKFPFMIERTPYGADYAGDTLDFSPYPAYADMAKDGLHIYFSGYQG